MKKITSKLPALCAVAAGSYGVLHSFISAFYIKCDTYSINRMLLVFILLSFLLIITEKTAAITIAITTLVVFYHCLSKYREVVLNGFFHTENAVIEVIRNVYEVDWYYYIVEYNEREAITAFMYLLSFIVVIIMAFACFYGMQKFFAYILAALSSAGSLIIGGSPDVVPILCIVLFFVFENAYGAFINETEETYQTDNKLGSGVSPITIFSGIFVFFIISVLVAVPIVTSSGFIKFIKVKEEKKENFIKAVENFSINISANNITNKFKQFFSDDEKLINIYDAESLVGGVGGGVFSRKGTVKFQNISMLNINIPSNYKTFYLKGFIGVNYTEEGWKELDGEQQLRYEKIGGNYKTIDILKNKLMYYTYYDSILFNKTPIVVDYINASKDFVYTNVYTDTAVNNAYEYCDAVYKPIDKSVGSYVYSFYQLDIQDIYKFKANEMYSTHIFNKSLINYFNQYEKYVYDVYTQIPDNIKRIEAAAEAIYGDDIAEYKTLEGFPKMEKLMKMLETTKEYIAEQADYSLTPGEIPRNENFAEYFLYKSHKGYCVHYATSAVLLLRCAGVPVRYAEGYIIPQSLKKDAKIIGIMPVSDIIVGRTPIINQNEISQNIYDKLLIDVKDTNAHAWIEVYVDGYGWVDYEMTEGYSAENINQTILDSYKEDITPEITPAEDITNTEPTDSPDDITPLPEPTSEPEPTQILPEPTGTNISSGNQGNVPLDNKKEGSTKVLMYFVQLLKILFIIVFLLLVLFLRYIAVRKYEKNYFANSDLKTSVLYAYKKIMRILQYKKFSINNGTETYEEFAVRIYNNTKFPKGLEEIFDIIQKAVFSNEDIDAEEKEKVVKYLNDLRSYIYSEKKEPRQRKLKQSKLKWIKLKQNWLGLFIIKYIKLL